MPLSATATIIRHTHTPQYQKRLFLIPTPPFPPTITNCKNVRINQTLLERPLHADCRGNERLLASSKPCYAHVGPEFLQKDDPTRRGTYIRFEEYWEVPEGVREGYTAAAEDKDDCREGRSRGGNKITAIAAWSEDRW